MNSIYTPGKRNAVAIAVGGGKGGVGKSVISLNLAITLAKLGKRVTIIDADFGSANLHTMLGIDRPGPTLQALLDGESKELSDVTLETGIENLWLVPGSVAVPGAANLHHGRKQKLIRQIQQLPCDVAIVDCGAGIHYNTVDLFTAADVQLLVASPQLVSLQNAYGFLKASVYRMLRQHAQALGKAEIVEAATDKSEVETVSRLLSSILDRDVSLGMALTSLLEHSRFMMIGNQLSDPHEQAALQALSRMISDFLHLKVPVLGALQRRDRIHFAVSRRRPFTLDNVEPESSQLRRMAQQLLATCDVVEATGRPSRVELTGRAQETSDRPRGPVHQSGIEYRAGADPNARDAVAWQRRARSR